MLQSGERHAVTRDNSPNGDFESDCPGRSYVICARDRVHYHRSWNWLRQKLWEGGREGGREGPLLCRSHRLVIAARLFSPSSACVYLLGATRVTQSSKSTRILRFCTRCERAMSITCHEYARVMNARGRYLPGCNCKGTGVCDGTHPS